MFGQSEGNYDPYREQEVNFNFMKKAKAHKEKYTQNVSGTEIIVFPEVYPPNLAMSASVGLMIQNMVSPHQKRVLDVGTGELNIS